MDFKKTGRDYNDLYELRVDSKENKFYFSWQCPFFENVFALGGEDMLKKYYPQMVHEEEPLEGHDLSLSYSLEEV